MEQGARQGVARFERLAGNGVAAGSGLFARHAAMVGTALFSFYVLLVSLTVVVFPDANWDMLPYLAVAEEGRFADPTALHDFAYGTVKAGVTEGAYQALIDDGGGYRSHMATDPSAFQSMLSMYRVKLLYTETLSTLSRVMAPIAAMQAIQVFSTLLFGAVVLLWLRHAGALVLAPLVGALLIVTDFASVARSNSPDLLCSALLLGGLLAHACRRDAMAGLLILLAVLVRPDTIVFVVILTLLLVALREWSIGILVAAGASLAAYFAISSAADHPGWWPHLYFSSVEQQLSMDGFDPAFSVAAYAKAFANAFARAITFNTWVGTAILALGGWYMTYRAGFRLERRAGIVFAALVLATLAKFVVFPIHDTRIYFPNLIPPFLLLAVPLMALVASVNVHANGSRRREASRT